MNELNYASLEASKRLVEAGVVLKTNFYWHIESNGKQELIFEGFAGFMECSPDCQLYPAPSMAEVWRELPSYIGDDFYLAISKDDTQTVCGYSKIDGFDRYVSKGNQRNDNPTDALIDLLIWVLKEKAR